ncbi:hypothetical protein DIPPA_04223 [Diplonema papillatum]|nr:hypothetical protein DIPPA_04223 [Diplonema papillatum]
MRVSSLLLCIALAGSGHALLLDRVAALETTVASQLTMLLDLQSRLTALEQTMGAEKQTTEVLHGTVAALGRQMIAFEHRTAERVRSQGQSGLTLVRSYNQGTDPFYTTSFSQQGAAAIHNHANTHHTVGIGEFGAVLNGVQFTTRHNDYSLAEADDTISAAEYISTWPPRAKAIEHPPVPPSVLNAGNVTAQMKEMREYFRAFHEQDDKHRDYKPYFPAIMCYLEGTWTEASNEVAEPFASERHHIDAETWAELNEKTAYLANNGQKNNEENLPILPTTVRDMRKPESGNTFEPVLAQWFYRVSCKKLKDDLPTSRFRVRNDLHMQMAEAKPVTRETLGNTARAVFDVDPTPSASWRPNRSFPKGKTRYEFMDELMSEISGFSGPNAFLKDASFGSVTGTYNDGEPMNTARYSRYYSLLEADAMGRRQRKRAFNDMLFAAQTTHSKVSPQSVCAKLPDPKMGDDNDAERTNYCKVVHSYDECSALRSWNASEVTGGASSAKCAWKVNKCEYQKCWTQRWSYAIPLEVVYLTPLGSWNPYNINYHANPSSPEYREVRNNRHGIPARPFNGTRQDTFYRTPTAFFGDLDEIDDADTSGGSTMVLDKDGNSHAVRASGTFIQLPPMGDLKNVRQRYPIFPVHEHGSTMYKEIKAMEELIMGRHSEHVTQIIAETRDTEFGVELELSGGGHTHHLHITPGEMALFRAGTRTGISKMTLEANGHQHFLAVRYDRDNVGKEWSLESCNMGGISFRCGARNGECTERTDVPFCCDGRCPDGHTGIHPLS